MNSQDNKRLKDVFTPGGQPSITYVSRNKVDLEGSVRKAIKQGFHLNVITGPTKSGKTVLCTRVLSSEGEYILIEGGQIRTEEDFWTHIAYHLNIPKVGQKSISDSSTDSISAGGKASLPLLASAEGNVARSSSEQKTSSSTYENVTSLACIKVLISKNITLLVDDFHYIDKGVQKSIIQALKGPIFKGLSVIFLAVTHRAFDTITVEEEMQGRFKHIAIPSWSSDELYFIPHKGFEALNVTCSEDIKQKICNESFSNPLLVQEICSELCVKANIFETAQTRTAIDEKTIAETLEEVAKSKGFPKYRKLNEGPQSRSERLDRKLRDGGTADIYNVIMIALARLGPKTRTHYDELRSSLKEILEESMMPQKNEITAALSQMSLIAKKIEGEPPLEFIKDEDALVITDPFLLFYMRWEKSKIAPGSEV